MRRILKWYDFILIVNSDRLLFLIFFLLRSSLIFLFNLWLSLGEMIFLLALGRQSESSFFFTNFAKRLSILVLTTLEAKLKIKTKCVLLIWIEIYFVFNIFSTEKLFCTTSSAFETIWTFPTAFWNIDKFRLHTPIVISFITNCAQNKSFPLFWAVTLFTENTVIAEPTILISLCHIFGTRKAVRMETFAAEITANEFLFKTKWTTQVAHFFENETWIIKAHPDWVAIPTRISFITQSKTFH